MKRNAAIRCECGIEQLEKSAKLHTYYIRKLLYKSNQKKAIYKLLSVAQYLRKPLAAKRIL